MRNPEDICPPGIDDRVERLICRCLDQEATPEERAELAGLLLRDAGARRIHAEYRRLDALAAEALRLNTPASGWGRPAGGLGSWWGRWRVAAVGAVATAAAVVAWSFLPLGRQPSNAEPQPMARTPRAVGPAGDAVQITPRPGWPVGEYQPVDHVPTRHLHHLYRDVIGIRAKDRNVIYLIERSRRSTTIVPISGDL